MLILQNVILQEFRTLGHSHTCARALTRGLALVFPGQRQYHQSEHDNHYNGQHHQPDGQVFHDVTSIPEPSLLDHGSAVCVGGGVITCTYAYVCVCVRMCV